MQYVASTILLNQALSLLVLPIGTFLVCAAKLWRFRHYGPLASPLMNPVFWASLAIAAWLWFGFFLDADMHLNDDNQQAQLRTSGITTSAQIISVAEVGTGRNLNTRFRWAYITCEFTDASGRPVRAASIEGYNWVYAKSANWKPGGIWAPGAIVDIIYRPDDPHEFRIASAVRADKVWPANKWDFLLALFGAWYVTVAWLSLLLFFLFIRPHQRTRIAN